MDSAIIEVGLGLVMVYFILSIVVTQLNNLIINSLNLRAENLHAWFRQVIQHQEVRGELLKQFGMVKLNAGEQKVNIVRRVQNWLERRLVSILVPGAGKQGETTDVSSVTPSVFADVLMGMAMAKSPAVITATSEMEKVTVQSAESVSAVDPEKLKAVRETNQKALDTTKLKALKEFTKTNITDASLESMVASASSVEDAQKKIAAWFDNSMTHLTSLFKRRVQFIGFLAGLFVCIVINVDTLYLARTLWNDPTMRQTLATAAAAEAARGNTAQSAEAQAQNLEDVTNRLQPLLDLRLPIGWESIPIIDCAPEAIAAQTCTPTAQAQVQTAQQNPRNLANFLPSSNTFGGWLNFILYKITGWILTTFAIMQGSDFWFNLLGRLTAARTNVTKLNEAISGGQIPPSQ